VRFQRCAAFEPGLLKSSFGQGQAITSVIGPFEKGAVDRRWPAWDLISHFLDDFFLMEMIFPKLEAKAFYLGN